MMDNLKKYISMIYGKDVFPSSRVTKSGQFNTLISRQNYKEPEP